MLDTLACVSLINKQAVIQQSRYSTQLQSAFAIWNRLKTDHALQETLRQKRVVTFGLPLDTVYSAGKTITSYSVCGIDGSQIYPDRHEGFSEYLINIGTAHFSYSAASSAHLHTQPFIFSGLESGTLVTPEYVNSQRTGYELQLASKIAALPEPPCIMFDGALMFWHLQAPTLQQLFLHNYLQSLQIIKNTDTLYMGYISLSHSREIITLIEAAAELLGDKQTFEYLVDTDILELFLEAGKYTQVFKTNSTLSQLYPESLEPYFVYLHVGSEVARLEVPAYCSHPEQLEYLVQIVLDQNKKGNGYPVALSEAHEQAVVKAADREFFYTLLRMQYQQTHAKSLKLSKKRSAAV